MMSSTHDYVVHLLQYTCTRETLNSTAIDSRHARQPRVRASDPPTTNFIKNGDVSSLLTRSSITHIKACQADFDIAAISWQHFALDYHGISKLACDVLLASDSAFCTGNCAEFICHSQQVRIVMPYCVLCCNYVTIIIAYTSRCYVKMMSSETRSGTRIRYYIQSYTVRCTRNWNPWARCGRTRYANQFL